MIIFFFFSSRRRHTRCGRDWSSDVCSSDLEAAIENAIYLAYNLNLSEQQIRITADHIQLDKVKAVVNHSNTIRKSDTKTNNLLDRYEAAAIHVLEKGLNVNGKDRKSTRLNSSHVRISYAVF